MEDYDIKLAKRATHFFDMLDILENDYNIRIRDLGVAGWRVMQADNRYGRVINEESFLVYADAMRYALSLVAPRTEA